MYLRFEERIRAPRLWTRIAFFAPRGAIALVLAVLPALALLVVATVWSPATEATRVRDGFARYISGLITAATIAVGFATLSLRRGLKGIGELREHVEADRKYADQARELTGREPPIGVGGLLAELLEATAVRARELRETELAMHAEDVAERVRRAGVDPDLLLRASVDLDAETAMHDARARLRDERLASLLQTSDVGRSYVKTLATQWGLSRMSQAIALTAMLAVVVATAMVLTYEPGPHAPAVLSAAVAVVLLPLAIFVAYAMRFTFVNQHTLPIGHFVLGPEHPRAARADARGGQRS